MGRNEIRLRRQKMSSGRIAQHRNYGELMERHERDVKLRRIAKIFIYFLIIAALLIMFVIVSRWEGKKGNGNRGTACIVVEKTSITTGKTVSDQFLTKGTTNTSFI